MGHTPPGTAQTANEQICPGAAQGQDALGREQFVSVCLSTMTICLRKLPPPPPPTKAGGTHSPGGKGGGGSIFWKTRDIGLPSYSNNLFTA